MKDELDGFKVNVHGTFYYKVGNAKPVPEELNFIYKRRRDLKEKIVNSTSVEERNKLFIELKEVDNEIKRLKVIYGSDDDSELNTLIERRKLITEKIRNTTDVEEKSKLLQELREIKDKIKVEWFK